MAFKQQTFSEIAERHRAPLGHKAHTTRTAALQTLHGEIDAAATHQLAALQDAMTAVRDNQEKQRQAAAAVAEATRRSRADALLAELFAPSADALASLIHAFRAEPSRVCAAKIRAVWDAFNTRAVDELGAELDTNVLGKMMIDDILAEPGFAGAVAKFAQLDFGDATGQTRDCLYAAAHGITAQATYDALIAAESAMTAVATWHRRTYPDPEPSAEHVALHGLRGRHATRADLINARAALDATQAAVVLAESVRNAPPAESEHSFWRRIRGIPDADAAE